MSRGRTMTFRRLPEFPSEAEAIAYCDREGLQVIELHRGAEGFVRGTAFVGALPVAELQGADAEVMP